MSDSRTLSVSRTAHPDLGFDLETEPLYLRRVYRIKTKLDWCYGYTDIQHCLSNE